MRLHRHAITLILVLAIVALVSALVVVASGDDPQADARTATFAPVADAWVGEETPDGNFGDDTALEVDGSAVQQAFLRFELDGIDDSVTAALLRLYVDNPSGESGGAVATSSDTAWDEQTITWDSRPEIDGPVLQTIGPIERATWVEFDVTDAVTEDGPITLVISSDASDGVAYATRETDTPPELVILHGNASAPPPGMTPIPIQGGAQRSTATPGEAPTPTAIAPTIVVTPPSGEPFPMPGTVEAEDYRPGGEGVGYHDTSSGNNGGEYRQDGVDIERCNDPTSPDPCFNIGYIRAGEWLAYDLSFDEAGEYAVSLRVSGWNNDRGLHLEIDGENVSGRIVVPNTGSPQNWTDVTTGPISFPAGTVTLRITTDDEGFNLNRFTVGTVEDVVFVGAGDIGECASQGDELTADLLDDIDGTIFTTGDNAYPDGTPENFADCFEPSWGRHKDRIRPTPGNHEFVDRSGEGYYGYFGEAAGEPGKGYYSYQYGSWHIIALNSNCSRGGDEAGCDPGDPQVEWLIQDLAENPNSCTLAYWHHPRWSSGEYGDDENMQTFWDVLYDAGVDVVVNGHEHFYERYAPLDADGDPDNERGIRQFIVGTGGGELGFSANPHEHSEVIALETFGLLKLTLSAGSYEWEFVPAEGSTFTDAGSGTCHP